MGYLSSLAPFRRHFLRFSFLGAAGGLVIAAACAKGGSGGPGFGGGGGGGESTDGGGGGPPEDIVLGGGGNGNPGGNGNGVGPVSQSTCTTANPCSDFPTAALLDTASGLTSSPASLFSGTPSTSGGPCLYEPQDGTLYPNGGTMTQPGWVRPRISWVPASGETVFQITLSAPEEKNSYVIYTNNTYWTMDKTTWLALSQNFAGSAGGTTHQISVTVAGTTSTGGAVTASLPAHFTIASLPASGALVYWSTQSFDNNAASTELKGFHVGDEATTVALQSTQVQQQVVATQADGSTPNPYVTNSGNQPVAVYCIGCHTATPDGLYVAFNAQWPWPAAMASLGGDGGGAGAIPTWLTTGARANMNPLTPLEYIMAQGSPLNGALSNSWYSPPVINQMMLGVQTFSAGHYSATDRKVVTTLGSTTNALSITAADTPTGVNSELAWIDLQWTGTPAANGAGLPAAPCGTATNCLPSSNGGTAGWGILTRTGDSNSAGAPSWSHNPPSAPTVDVVAYTSVGTGGVKDGRLENGPGSIWTVPYGGGMGGTATQLGIQGTAAANNNYYPSWSPDDQLIAFNSAPTGVLMYNQPAAEVYVVPYNGGKGGTAVRLAANDTVSCTGSTSPGVKNTWPKWAPLPEVSSGASAGNLGTDGKLYYWVTFSSTRNNECSLSGATGGYCTGPSSNSTTEAGDAVGRAQLYVAPVVVDPTMNNAITTYPAIYMWNQDPGLNNLIPSWEFFPIPPGTGSILK